MGEVVGDELDIGAAEADELQSRIRRELTDGKIRAASGKRQKKGGARR